MDTTTFEAFMKLTEQVTITDDIRQLKIIHEALLRLADGVENKVFDLEPEPQE
jgi:hypothetical protein